MRRLKSHCLKTDTPKDIVGVPVLKLLASGQLAYWLCLPPTAITDKTANYVFKLEAIVLHDFTHVTENCFTIKNSCRIKAFMHVTRCGTHWQRTSDSTQTSKAAETSLVQSFVLQFLFLPTYGMHLSSDCKRCNTNVLR